MSTNGTMGKPNCEEVAAASRGRRVGLPFGRPFTMRPIGVSFLDPEEIRMGSPFSVCTVCLTGDWVPELPSQGRMFQDLSSWSDDGRHLALVQWQIESNQPGFRLVLISIPEKRVVVSNRLHGCCSSLHWKERRVLYHSYPDLSGSVELQ